MKKYYYIFIFIFLFCFINISFAFLDQRYQYWNIRFKTLSQEKNKLLNKGNTDKSIINLINNDIKRTEDILKLFENSLNTRACFEKRKYTKTEVRGEIKKVLMPLFSLNYLEFILDKTGKIKSYELAGKCINDLLDREIYNYFSVLDTSFREIIKKEKFSKSDWKYLVVELWLEQMISNRKKQFHRIASQVEKKISHSLAKIGFLTSPKDLENMIESVSKDTLAKYNMNNIIKFPKNPLMGSWCWQEKKDLITSDFRNDKNILEFLKKADTQFSLGQIHLLSRNVAVLDNLYFNKLFNNYYNQIKALKENTTLDKNTLLNVQNSYFLNIPDIPNLSLILSDIDRLRDELIKDIDGNETGHFYRDMEDRFNSIILNTTSVPDTKFCEEERLLNGLASGSFDNRHGLKLSLVNKAEFDNAKILFKKYKEFAYDYIKENIKFLKLVSKIRKTDSYVIFNGIKRRFGKNTHYIESLEKLAVDCAGFETLTEPSLYKRYHSIILRIRNLYNLLGYSLNIGKKNLRSLDVNQISEINSQERFVKQKIIDAGLNINTIYVSILKSLEEKRKKLIRLKYDIKDEIANSEIELYIDSIKEYISVYDRFSYGNTAFKEYEFTFHAILDNAKTGIKSDNLEQAIKLHSIIPLLSDFIPSKIKNEYNIKNYLKNKIRKKIASTRTLVTFYRRKGLKIPKIPVNFLDSVTVKLRSRPEVMIGSWLMNESNFEDVDKKAVQKLHLIIKRGIWFDNNSNKIITQNKIRIEDYKISLAIPEGWIEQSVSSWESNKGIIKAFKSIDGNSMIYIAVYDYNNNVKDASESWIMRMDSKKVYQEWGKRENADYFWTLSDNSKGVMESYAIPCDGRILILSGISTKDKYNFFKNKITSVFQSITSI